MPRKYRMRQREAGVVETRRRIVAAARELHDERGITGAGFDEIAARAGVAAATVYRHFPTLADLIPACAGTIPVLQHLDAARVAGAIPPLPRPSQRLEWLVCGTCDCYQRDGGWLRAARGEENLLPALTEVGRLQRKNLRLLVGAALADRDVGTELVALLAALIDFPFWQSLRQLGFDGPAATGQVLRLVQDQLDRAGID